MSMSRFTRRTQILGLLGWLAVTFAAAAVGAIASARAGSFYTSLSQPAWAPPSGVFAPVWNVLYALMAVAAWLVWRREGFGSARTALGLYLAQLVPNALWSWLFFGWRLGGAGVVDILVLWAMVAATVYAFARHHRGAAWLLVPYLGWITFAAALNYRVWRLNPDQL